jgi:hypothetical protein
MMPRENCFVGRMSCDEKGGLATWKPEDCSCRIEIYTASWHIRRTPAKVRVSYIRASNCISWLNAYAILMIT